MLMHDLKNDVATMRKTRLIIPAAGSGTRMGVNTPKTLTLVNGKPILGYIIDAIGSLVDEVAIVVSPIGLAYISNYMATRETQAKIIVQPKPIGMADAVMRGQNAWHDHNDVDYIIVWGDQVTVNADTVYNALTAHRGSLEKRKFATIPVCKRNNPYINIEHHGTHIRVCEQHEGDIMPLVGLSDIGVFIFDGIALATFLGLLYLLAYDNSIGMFTRINGFESKTKEFNFLPIIEIMSKFSLVKLHHIDKVIETLGINTPNDIVEIERRMACPML